MTTPAHDLAAASAPDDPRPARGSKIVPLVVSCGFFMEGFDGTVITTALPAMSLDLGATPVELSLAVTAYLMSLAVFIPISGWLADRYGMKTIFRGAVALFTVASIFCAAAQTLDQLVVARILLGIAGAMMAPVGRLVVLRSVPKSEYVKAMALVTTPALLGPLLGPPVGGFLTTYVSWRWIFIANVPIGLAGLVAISLFIKEYKPPTRHSLDWLGFALTTLTVACLMVALEMATNQGQGTLSALLLALGLGLGGLVWLHSSRTPHPLMRVRLFAIPTFNIATVSGVAFRVIVGAVPFLLPVLLQIGLGMTAFDSGLLVFSMAIGLIALKAAAPALLKRYGFRRLVLVNGALSTLSVFACAAFDASTPLLVVCFVLLLFGAFRSLQVSALQSLTYADMSPVDMSGATSFSNGLLQFGNGAGVALSAFLLFVAASWRGGDAGNLVTADVQWALAAIGVVSFLSMLPLFFLKKNAGEELSGYREKARA
ncbi:MAG: MFS transporter [Alphaproteobacteria bacterium]